MVCICIQEQVDASDDDDCDVPVAYICMYMSNNHTSTPGVGFRAEFRGMYPFVSILCTHTYIGASRRQRR